MLHRYYNCGSQFKPGGSYCGRMRADPVEAALLQQIARVLAGPDVVERLRRRCVEDVMRGSTDLQKRRAEIETALAESRRRVEVMYGDRLSGALSLDTFTRLSQGEEEKQAAYEKALANSPMNFEANLGMGKLLEDAAKRADVAEALVRRLERLPRVREIDGEGDVVSSSRH